MTDITQIKRMLTDRSLALCEHLLPKGIKRGRDWCVGSISGEAGDSLKVCISGAKQGRWADFAPGGDSGDVIDLWCAVRGVQLAEALNQICEWLDIQRPSFEGKRERPWRRPEKPQCVRPTSAVLDYLTDERRISRDAITAYRVGENGRTIVFHSFLPDGTLAFVKYLGVDRPDGKKATRVEADCEPVLFGWQAVPENAREITVCEGEIDSLSMYDYGYPALSVPFGGGKGNKQQWIESEYERMARFEVIYLALDNDKEGELAAEEIANRLGRHRCRRVLLPFKDANECVQKNVPKDIIDKCFEGAKSLDPPELRRVGEFTDAVVRQFWPAEEIEPGYRLPFAKIRDKLLFRPGEFTIWSGPSGAGKSQVLSHAAVAFIDQGARICIASLEMSAVQLLRRMVKQAGNVNKPTEEYIRVIMEWMDRSTWVFDLVGKSPVKRLIEVFEYARARYGCDTFVVDSLMRLGIGSEDYEGQERAVYEMVNWTTASNVHTHLVAHSRKSPPQASGVPDTEDIKGASEIGSNAFNIISVWRNKKLEDEIKQLEGDARYSVEAQSKLNELVTKPGVVLNLAKQRNGDHEGKCGLWFNQLTYQYRSAEDSAMGVTFVSLKDQ